MTNPVRILSNGYLILIFDLYDGMSSPILGDICIETEESPIKSKERQLTEYILIGTLLSFGLAVAVAFAIQIPAG